MNLFKIIGQIFEPAAKLVDDLHTSTEEKLAAKAAMLQTQASFLEYALDYETKSLEARSRIVEAEAKSESWLTSNWRPLTMITFLGLVVSYWFGLTPDTITEAVVDNVFGLIKLGLGGYVVGRSAEKVIPGITKALKQKDEV